MQQLTAIAPGKLILSGEHAVVYGNPALALAINYYTSVTTKWHSLSTSCPQQLLMVSFKFLDLKYAQRHTLQALEKVKVRLQNKYNAFLQGQVSLREVLKRPFELLQYSVSNLLEKLNVELPHGLELKINSEIPIGCGMGSSAAAIVSVLYALIKLFNLNLDPAKFLKLGLEAENLQHGKSSGLDLQLAAFGGSIRYQQGTAYQRPVPQLPLYFVNTGAADTSTGECVQQVAKVITVGSTLADFAAITNAMDYAMQKQDLSAVKLAITENQRLLQSVGVVPPAVAAFIAEIEASNGAAKVCGAGAIRGDKAGIVLIVGEADFAPIAAKYGYQLQAVQADLHGARII